MHLVVMGSSGARGSAKQLGTFKKMVQKIIARSEQGHITIYKLDEPVNAFDLRSNEDAFKKAIKLLGKESNLSPKHISVDMTPGNKVITVASSMVAVNTDAASVYTYIDQDTNPTNAIVGFGRALTRTPQDLLAQAMDGASGLMNNRPRPSLSWRLCGEETVGHIGQSIFEYGGRG